MSSWKELLRSDPLPWLLERDEANPGVRYFALRDLMGLPQEDRDVREARSQVMAAGPVSAILAAQQPEGFWVKPGPGYAPKYTGTVWQLIFLAQFGADGTDPRVRAACQYVLDHSRDSNGGFLATGTPNGFIHCLAGNLACALIDLGRQDDPRLRQSLEWQSHTITGEGVAATEDRGTTARYYKSGTSGPLFACAANAGLSCAWGGVKSVLALAKVPSDKRTPVMTKALERGVAFLLSKDPAVADYPFGYGARPSSSWFKLGYPIGYVTDVLQNLEALAAAGVAQDERLAHALELVLSKQDSQGRWNLAYSYDGKMWIDVERKGQPSKWVTLRALRVLKAAYPE